MFVNFDIFTLVSIRVKGDELWSHTDHSNIVKLNGSV